MGYLHIFEQDGKRLLRYFKSFVGNFIYLFPINPFSNPQHKYRDIEPYQNGNVLWGNLY